MAWYDSNWGRRLKITSDNTKVASSVKGLALDLSTITSDDFWDYVASDGADIRITESDETTELARDVISIDTTAKTGLIRFDTSGISTSSDTDFYIYFDNSSATEPSPSDTYGQYNAYDSASISFWPHEDGTGTITTDRTENGFDGSITNASWTNNGQLNKAMDFDGSGDKITVSDSPELRFGTDSFTISFWDYPRGSPTTNSNVRIDKGGVSGAGSIYIYEGGGSGKRWRIRFSGSDIFQYVWPSFNTWYHFFLVREYGMGCKLYINGELADESSNGATTNINSSANLTIGSQPNNARPYDGILDEMLFIRKALTSDDNKTIYNNESDNSAFWTIGSVEEGTVTLNLEETFSSSDGDILIANRLFSETIDSDDDITNTPDYVPFVIKGKVSRGSGVENAKVYLYNQSTGVIDATDTTDANGNYIFNNLDRDVLYSVGCVEYEEDGTKYNEKTFYDIEAKPE